MPAWLQAVFAITVLASLVFVVAGVVGVLKTRGKVLRPWLLCAVGLITMGNVYLLTAPVAPTPQELGAAIQEGLPQ